MFFCLNIFLSFVLVVTYVRCASNARIRSKHMYDIAPGGHAMQLMKRSETSDDKRKYTRRVYGIDQRDKCRKKYSEGLMKANMADESE